MHIGFDIGGTKTEIIVLDKAGEVQLKKRIATLHDYPQFINNIVSLVSEAEFKVNHRCTIGIGIPGVVNPRDGLVKNANCTFLNGRPLLQDLTERLGRAPRIANDANCLTLSEAVDGAAAGQNVVFGVILGTGCGGGIVVNQEVITGLNANTGEWGHNPLPSYSATKDGFAPPCFCGSKNCLEQYISGTGFARQYNSRLSAGLTSVNQPPASLTVPEIMTLVEQGDGLAIEVYQLFIDQLARSLAVIVNILDPDAIVIGGGLSNVDRIYQNVTQVMPQYTITADVHINVMKARFGDSSGIRGAAWLGRA